MKPIPMHAIPRNSTQFREYLIASFFRNYSAIARNEMAQAEATIARNGIPIGNPRIYVYFYYPEIDIMESVFSTIFSFFILKKKIVQ